MDLEITVRTLSDNTYKSYHLTVKDRLVLGRGPDSAIPFEGTRLSRDHFVLTNDNGRLYVEDLSTNGTQLNGNPLHPGTPHNVNPGSTIQIPGFEINIDAAGGLLDNDPTPAAGTQTLKLKAAVKPPPKSPLEAILTPIKKFWSGFSSVERTVIYATILCALLVYAYYQAN